MVNDYYRFYDLFKLYINVIYIELSLDCSWNCQSSYSVSAKVNDRPWSVWLSCLISPLVLLKKLYKKLSCDWLFCHCFVITTSDKTIMLRWLVQIHRTSSVFVVQGFKRAVEDTKVEKCVLRTSKIIAWVSQ